MAGAGRQVSQYSAIHTWQMLEDKSVSTMLCKYEDLPGFGSQAPNTKLNVTVCAWDSNAREAEVGCLRAGLVKYVISKV